MPSQLRRAVPSRWRAISSARGPAVATALPPGRGGVQRARTSSKWGRKATKFLRRLHLYSGLFLVPFVLLYGATGYLFNHPSAFADEQHQSVGAGLLVEAGARPTDPATLAGDVVEALNRLGSDVYSVVEGSPQYRGRYVFRRRHDDAVYSLILPPDLTRAELVLQRRPASTADAEPRPDRTVARESAREQLDRVRATAERVFDLLGLEGRGASVRSAPDVDFALRANDGRQLTASLDLRAGALDVKDSGGDARADLSTRRFLTRLHKSHTYPAELGPRWWWSLMVDVTAVTMLVWGLTGLVMWWQIRTLRRIGLSVLALSALWTAYLAVGMHSFFTN